MLIDLIPFSYFSNDIQKDCGDKKTGNGPNWLLVEGGGEKELTCCADCSAKFESEAQSSRNTSNSHGESTSSTLPSWLKDEFKRLNSNDQVNILTPPFYTF